MVQSTCAACDCKLEADVITVKVGGKTVEVCCADCADSVKEAYAATASKEAAR